MSIEAANWVSNHTELKRAQKLVLYEIARWVDPRGMCVGLTRQMLTIESGYGLSHLARIYKQLQDMDLIKVSQYHFKGLPGTIPIIQLALNNVPDPSLTVKVPTKLPRFIGVRAKDPLQVVLRLAEDEAWNPHTSSMVYSVLQEGLYARLPNVTPALLGSSWEALRVAKADIAAAKDPWQVLLREVFRKLKAEKLRNDGISLNQAVEENPASQATMRSIIDGSISELTIGYDELLTQSALCLLVKELIKAGTYPPLAWYGTLHMVKTAAKYTTNHRYTQIRKDPEISGFGIGAKTAEAWMRLVVGARGDQTNRFVPKGTQGITELATELAKLT